MSKYYGVTQSHYGHEYRWIFEESTVMQHTDGNAPKDTLDIRWPIRGSNSSATEFLPIETDEDAKEFLTAPGSGPDVEDPMLVDLAEYLVTIEVDEGCADEFLDRLGLSANGLFQYDDKFGRMESSERMVAEMLQYEENLPELVNYHVIDSESPFYGESRYIRYSELCEMYEEFSVKKEEWDNEKESTVLD